MNILFHSNQLGLRGTEVALYDYAYYARKLLNVNSMIISDKNSDLSALEKFQAEFPVYLYDTFSEVESIVNVHKIDMVYYQKAGQFDNKLVKNAKNLVHAVFQFKEPHGEKYSYISNWLNNQMQWNSFVPYIVDIPKYIHDENFREYFNIPVNAFVFGYHGGKDSFNIEWVKHTIQDVALRRSDVYFIFMNVIPFCEQTDNILFVEGTYDMYQKVGFINTCDAMLHARNGGESFGLSIAEFSSLNKPVLTTSWCSVALNDLAHIDMLGDKAILYDPATLNDILMNISHTDVKHKNWNAYSSYQPENVMNKFKTEFL